MLLYYYGSSHHTTVCTYKIPYRMHSNLNATSRYVDSIE